MPRDERGNKWACVTCISGHRATTCDHFDRWMMAVKAAGRPSKRCTHPDKSNCDCEGLRMVLMVAIPNKQKCQCKKGSHECLMGEQYYMTRVANKDVTPHVDQSVLDQRLAMSEAGRVANRSPPTTLKDKQPSFQSNVIQHQHPQPMLQSPPVTESTVVSTPAPSSCCRQSTVSSGQTPIAQNGFVNYGVNGFSPAPMTPASDQYYAMPAGFATIENPMTQQQFQQMEAENPNWQRVNATTTADVHACSCAPNQCNCDACPSHPFNAQMNQTVWDLAQSSAQEMSKLAISSDSGLSDPFSNGFNSNIHPALQQGNLLPNENSPYDPAAALSPGPSGTMPDGQAWTPMQDPSLPPMTSAAYRFYQYEGSLPEKQQK